MKAFGKHILVKDIEENLVEAEQEVLTEEEVKAEEETGIPTQHPNLPPQVFARLVEVFSVGNLVNLADKNGYISSPIITVGMKVLISHHAGDVIDEGIRVVGINSVLAIKD